MTDKQLSFRILGILNKQVKVYSEHLLREYSEGMSRKAKTKLTNRYTSAEAFDDFYEEGATEEELDENYELSAEVLEVMRYLIKFPDLAPDVENSIIECLKQEKRL
jgi:hypothetical protein